MVEREFETKTLNLLIHKLFIQPVYLYTNTSTAPLATRILEESNEVKILKHFIYISTEQVNTVMIKKKKIHQDISPKWLFSILSSQKLQL